MEVQAANSDCKFLVSDHERYPRMHICLCLSYDRGTRLRFNISIGNLMVFANLSPVSCLIPRIIAVFSQTRIKKDVDGANA